MKVRGHGFAGVTEVSNDSVCRLIERLPGREKLCLRAFHLIYRTTHPQHIQLRDLDVSAYHPEGPVRE